MPRRVLVVENDLLTLQTLERCLGEHFDVITARSAEEALKIIEAERPFKVATTVAVMPGMSGLSLARKLHSISPATAVILFSAYSFAEEELADLPNVRAFLEKPFAIDSLIDRIEELLCVT